MSTVGAGGSDWVGVESPSETKEAPQLARYTPSPPPNPHSHPHCTWSKAKAAVNLASFLS